MNQTVLITGASRGIGRAAAIKFARAGWNVALNYHHSSRQAMELAEELAAAHCSVLPLQADVSRREQVDAMVAQALHTFGHIDALVNNCGIAQQKLFTDLSEADWDRMFDVNLKSMFHCCQSVLPHMLRRHSGCIVNLSSIWGIAGASCEVHYSASKAAVIGLTKALAKEVGPSGIRVNCVAPGVVATDMNANLDEETMAALKEETPLETIGTPEDIAESIYFLCTPASRFTTGQVLSPNGGIVI